MSPGAYYAAPEGGGPARLLAILAVVVVVGGGGIWLAQTKPWLPPAEPQQEEQEAPAPAAREIAVPIAPPAPAEEAEEEAPSPVPARAVAGGLSVVFVESFACRAVESNSSWMAVAFQVSIGASDVDPAAGTSAFVSVLDADGFMLENKTLYNVAVSPGDTNLLQDRLLVSHPQAARAAGCKVEIRTRDGATLDSSTASVEMAIPPPRPRPQQVQAPPVAAPSRPSYASRPVAKVWGEPKVHRYGSRAVVSFRIWNQGDETITSDVDVELYLNGEFVDSAGDLVEVAPGDKRLFEVTFDGVGQGGRATASVRVQ